MMTNAAGTAHTMVSGGIDRPAVPTTQKVVIVNGNAEILGLFEPMLEAGHYDVVFVESNTHAYSQIKRVQPNLVIMCVDIDEMDGFRVLSMLNLDQETRDIPTLTYATEHAARPGEEAAAEPFETELLALRPAGISMN